LANGQAQQQQFGLLEDLVADTRYALRALRRNPAYTAAAVLTLGLGIGANTAVFSVMDSVLLRPLPYDRAERLVLAGTFERGDPVPAAPFATYAEYLAWKAESRTLEAVGAYTSAPFRVSGGQEPVLAQALVIDAGLLPVLGVRPYIGAGFTADLDARGGARAVLLSYDHWQSNFGGDPGIVGGTIELNGHPYEVRGVLPAGFDFPPATRGAEGWLSLDPSLFVSLRAIEQEIGNYGYWVVGRLADGVTTEDAAAELAALSEPVAVSMTGEAAERDVRVAGLQEAVVGPLRPALLAFLCAVALVLLIACVNLGALMLARLSARERELGLRFALGAGRRRIARQLATESMIVAVLGGAAGIVIAAIGLQALVGAAPQDLPGLADAAINVRVLAFALLVTCTAGILVGVLPALRASGVAARVVNGGRGGVSQRGTRRTHGVLVVTEVALAAALLVAAGLLIRSFGVLAGIDPGFRDDHILTVHTSVPSDRYAARADVLAYYDDVERRIAALPGVLAVSAVDRLPFGRSSSRIPVEDRTDQSRNGAAVPIALNLTARPGYFEAMEIPLVQGRVFDLRDIEGELPGVVISRSLAEQLWPQGDVIGQHVTAFGRTLEVVGVVGDVRHFGPAVAPEPMIYFAHATDPFLRRAMTLVLRTRSSPEVLAPLVRAAIRAADPLVPISPARSFSALRAEKVAGERFNALLVGVSGALALLLVAVGIYGVMAFAIVHRTREIGIRIALGASSVGVLGNVLGEAARLVTAGLAIGLLTALPLTLLLRGLLFGIEPLDPMSFAIAATVMILVGMLAALLPARRAARVEPLAALREE
ncbi:MAG TPA: ABC transporter permease, partial [Longimicrobiales bacterium]|nr:ABC transporter permease [Longimicrobiales bacterium]